MSHETKCGAGVSPVKPRKPALVSFMKRCHWQLAASAGGHAFTRQSRRVPCFTRQSRG